MNQPAGRDQDREHPPLLIGLIGTGVARGGSGLRRVVRSVDQRLLLTLGGGAAVGMFLFILVASSLATPTFAGVMQGLFVGIFTALLVALGVLWLLAWARADPRAPAAAPPQASALADRLAPILGELNAMRADIARHVTARSVTRIPAGMALAAALWVLGLWTDDPPDLLDLVVYLAIGAVGGELWALKRLNDEYRRQYKHRILPQLASEFGALTYRQPSRTRVEALCARGILPAYTSLDADDEIAGTYDGLEVAIIETRLRRRARKKTRVVFDGLLVAVALPRALTSTTIVMTDRGALGNFVAEWRGDQMAVVRLDHAEFEQHFEAYSTDQIEARALLTPAFMERFVAMATSGRFAVPGAIAEGSTLVVALEKRFGTGDLFEPPFYWQPAGGEVLLRLQRDIRAVLRMADTVIHLDFWAAGRQRDAARTRAQTDVS